MLIMEVPQPLPILQMRSWLGCDAFAASTEVSELEARDLEACETAFLALHIFCSYMQLQLTCMFK